MKIISQIKETHKNLNNMHTEYSVWKHYEMQNQILDS